MRMGFLSGGGGRSPGIGDERDERLHARAKCAREKRPFYNNAESPNIPVEILFFSIKIFP